MHASLHARALTCEPPLHTLPDTTERENYRDEADRFYDDPVGFLSREMWPLPGPSGDAGVGAVVGGGEGERIPRYIVGFEGIEPWLGQFFGSTEQGRRSGVELARVWEGWNGFFNEDRRRAGKIVVWDTGM